MLVQLALAAVMPVTAGATDYVTNVIVIGGTMDEVNDLWYPLVKQGWTGVSYNLNRDAGGDYIYLLYKTENSPDDLYSSSHITDFYIKQGKSYTDELSHNGRTYHLVTYDGGNWFKNQKGDLNSGTGDDSDAIHLYYTTEAFPDHRAVISIDFNEESSGALGKNGDNTSGYDLNAGCGESSAYIYMHITTGTTKPFPGAGTADDPFRISSSDEWERLSRLIHEGQYADKCYKLTQDIPISTMLGRSSSPFRGVFDGNGKTVRLNFGYSDTYTAPFNCINGATIQNLTVEGNITGGPYTAGLVGRCEGTCTIRNCTVTASVTGDGHAGGIVGDGGTSTLTIEGCVFSGSIGGFNQVAGGILGWCDAMALTMNNCLFKGSFSPASGGVYHPIACYNPEKNVNATFTSTYYLNTITPTAYYFSESNFKPLSTEYSNNEWYLDVQAADGGTYYAKPGISVVSPYTYGFETSLASEGWSLVDGVASTEIIPDSMYEGSNCFKFSNDGDTPQYLISPEFDGQHAIALSFYQKLGWGSPAYQVGYSTSTNSVDAFTNNWDAQKNGSSNWTIEERTLPKGTKFVAIRCAPIDMSMILFDNFSFSACDTPAPIDLTVSSITDNAATLSWSEPSTDETVTYKWQYKKDSDSEWSLEQTTSELTASLSGLSGYTPYTFRVKALYNNGESIFISVNFRTSMALPYECGFENTDDIDKWTMKDEYWNFTKVYDSNQFGYAHSGRNSFCFYFLTEDKHDQYLISPQFSGTDPITVSFYYRNGHAFFTEKFQVGSSAFADASLFHWGEEIETDDCLWHLYEHDFPAGTRYIAIKYKSNTDNLFLDDFMFLVTSSINRPTGLTASEFTSQGAKITWRASSGATSYAYQYKKADESSWSGEIPVNTNAVILTGLAANTAYDFRVKACNDSGVSNYSTPLQFKTDGILESLPFFDDFFYSNPDTAPWRIIDGDGESGPGERIGDEGTWMVLSAGIPCLLSPELKEGKALVLSFSYIGIDDDPGNVTKLWVGWSSTNREKESFTWTEQAFFASPQKQQYIIALPAGTKYFAIKKEGRFFVYLEQIGVFAADGFAIQATAGILCGEGKYATSLYTDFCAFRLPDNARAYTVEKDGDDTVFRLVGDDGRIIPRSTGVIIVTDKSPGETAASKELVLTPLVSTDVVAHAGNILEGRDGLTFVIDGTVLSHTDNQERDVYVLGKDSNGVFGFYWFNAGHETILPERKAYFLK